MMSKKSKQAVEQQEGQFADGVKHNSEYNSMQKITSERDAKTTPAEKIDAYLKAKGLFIVGDWIPCTSEFIAFVEQGGYRKGYAAATELLKSNNNVEENVEMNAEQMKSLLNEVLDTRENNSRKDEIRLAELELQIIKEKIKLEELKVANAKPVEFNLTPFMTANVKERARELGIEWNEYERMNNLVKNFVYQGDDEVESSRKGIVKKTIMDVVSDVASENMVDIEMVETMNSLEGKLEEVLEDGPSTPIRHIDGRVTIAWRKVIAADKFLETMIALVQYAKDSGINVNIQKEFINAGSMFRGAYQQFNKIYSGRGAWADFVQFKIK